MAQFDVYLNPSQHSRSVFPYVVDVQTALLVDINTRLVIPLGKLTHFKQQRMVGLMPLVEYQQEMLVLLTPQIASLPAKLLKKPIGSLVHLRDDIIAAIDFALTGI